MSNQNKTEEKERIHFDAVVGNPPYQVTKESKNINIWQHFVKVANLVTGKWTSIICPGSWVVPKSQMEATNKDIVDSNLEKFNYFNISGKIFPDTRIEGGITILNFNKTYKGKPKYYKEGNFISDYDNKELFASDEFDKEIIEKVVNVYKGKKSLDERRIGRILALGPDLGYDKAKHLKFSKDTDKGMKNPIKIFGSIGEVAKSSKTGWFYIEKDKLDTIPAELLKGRKVMIAKIGGQGGYNRLPEIVEKNVTGQQLFFLPDNDTDYELKLIQSLLATKTARFLMGLKMKGLCVCGLDLVPDYTNFITDMKDPKYNNKMFKDKKTGEELGLLTDEYFYNKFNFSQELINHIESHISPKELV